MTIQFPGTKLSPSELEVALRLGRGERATNIAIDLNRSVKTISTHRQRIMGKTGFTSNAQLIRYVAEQELLAKGLVTV
jgi:DNA-binding NarL/FixJ family response regulator